MTGSGVYLCNLVRQFGLSGYGQAAVIGLPAALTGYGVPGIAPSDIREVLFETPALPYLIPGMSDVMPYNSTVFSTLSHETASAYMAAFSEAVRGSVLRFRPDVILSNHLWLATSAAAQTAASISGVQGPGVYAICHGTDLRQMQLSPQLVPLAVEGCRLLSGVFTLNHRQLAQIEAQYGIPQTRMTVAGTGYDGSVFYRGSQRTEAGPGPVKLVYAGKLSRSKGVAELIAAVGGLPAGSVRLTLAGSGAGPEAEAILEAAAQCPNQVTYAGMLSQERLAELFRESDIFILPSFYEGLPLVVVEAMACGLRVVVNDLPGLREWLGDEAEAAGQLRYVRMPPLEGPDICAPEAVGAYVKDLAAAIAQMLTLRPKPLAETVVWAQESLSWEAVQACMARGMFGQ